MIENKMVINNMGSGCVPPCYNDQEMEFIRLLRQLDDSDRISYLSRLQETADKPARVL